MKNLYLDSLIKQIRESIRKGRVIVVYGWLPKNHNETTLILERTKQVRFLERSSRINGVSEQTFVLMTKFVSHSDQEQLKKIAGEHYPHILTPGQIKKLLQEHKEEILSLSQVNNKPTVPETVNEDKSMDLNELERILIETEVAMDQYDKFAELFTQRASARSENLVSVHEMTIILKKIEGLPDKQKLRKEGWIVPVTQEGKKKAGWYEAGPKLLERIKADKREEPADGVEKALWLIEQEARFKKNRDTAQKEMERWEKQLSRVATAKEIFKSLDEL